MVSQRARQPEVREEAAVAKPGDGGDPVAFEGQNEDRVGGRDPSLRVGEIAAEGRLGVGPRGHDAQRPATHLLPVAEEGADRVLSLVLERQRRHGEPGVVGEQSDHLVDVAALDRLREAPNQPALGGGVGTRGALAVDVRQSLFQGCTGALQGALDRELARFEHLGGLGDAEAEHVAQHQHHALARRQGLKRGNERELD